MRCMRARSSSIAAPALALLVPALVGCGGAVYQPRPSPRLQVVSDGGGFALAKNGRIVSIGFLGGDLDEAVKGNARAEAEAKSFQAKSAAGFVLGLVGSLAGGAGAAVVVGNEVSTSRSSELRIAGISLAVGGVVLALVSSMLTVSAQKHLWNSVNIYNDELPPPWGFGAPRGMAPVPTYGPAAPPAWVPPYGQPTYAPPAYAPPAAAPPPSAPPAAPPPAPPAAPPSVAPPPQ